MTPREFFVELNILNTMVIEFGKMCAVDNPHKYTQLKEIYELEHQLMDAYTALYIKAEVIER
jgi:hypothetical protein